MADLRIIDLDSIEGRYLNRFTDFVVDVEEGGTRKVDYDTLVESIVRHDVDALSGSGYAVKFGDLEDRTATLVPYDEASGGGVSLVARDADGYAHLGTAPYDDSSDKAATTAYVVAKLDAAISAAAAANAAKEAADVATKLAYDAMSAAAEAAMQAHEAASGLFPPATRDELGTVIVGDGLKVDGRGVLSTDLPVDSELSGDSENPVENGVVTRELRRLNEVLAGKAPVDSPLFTGMPRADTPDRGDSSSRLATTAFVARAGGEKQNSAGWSRAVLMASGWAGRVYSLEEDWPSGRWDVSVEPDESCTPEQMASWTRAGLVGSIDANVVTATLTVPQVDIPVIVRSVRLN